MIERTHKKRQTSWEPVEKWYRGLVGDEGHYYHQHIVIPGVLRLLELKSNSKLLDLGCGQGILARKIPEDIDYLGVDISPSFIKAAKQSDRHKAHDYQVLDVSKPFKLSRHFTHAAIILALQNMEQPELVIQNAFNHLEPYGRLAIVLNHPCFRVPRQSSWGIDQDKKIQYRRIDRYQNPMAIPIQAHPSKGEKSPDTISFHYPLSAFAGWLKKSGFVIETIEEWCSNKESTGKNAKMENRSREEIPLFLTIIAKKSN